MLRIIALSSLAMMLPALGLAQPTIEKSRVTLNADLLGSNENPSVSTANSGNFTITMDFDVEVDNDGALENFGEAVQGGFDRFLGFFGVNIGDDDGVAVERNDVSRVTITVRGNMDKPEGSSNQSVTGFHIHEGGSSENGPVVVGFDVTGLVASAGSTRISRSVTLTSTTDVDKALAIARNPSEYYLNLHTTENPSGEIRGQLRRSADDQTRQLRSEIMTLTRELRETRIDLNRLLEATQMRERQLNRIDANVAAIGRRNGLNTTSEEVVGSAR